MQGERYQVSFICLQCQLSVFTSCSSKTSKRHFSFSEIYTHIVHRVLFTAGFPHTVVHVNAAYGTLVKKGLAKPCALGHPMTTTNSIGNSNNNSSSSSNNDDWNRSNIEADEMTKLKEDETVSKIITNHLGISKEGINYHLFPIISDDESFCDFVRSYQKHDSSTHPCFNEFGKSTTGGYQDGEGDRQRAASHHSHVSHYLLQIEPVAQLTNESGRL